jgi:predicted dehydrogenase
MQIKGDHAKSRFALLGDHPDGMGMALALVAAGRYELAAFAGLRTGAEKLAGDGLAFLHARDLEEVLADPQTGLVIVAGSAAERPQQLRRALQSEKHVLCVYPPDHTPEIAYEAAMIQADTRRVLLPLLPTPLHPAIGRIVRELTSKESRWGTFTLIEIKQSATGPVVLESAVSRPKPALPGWEVLRALGGEIAEVSAFASGEEIRADEPLMLTGRFERQGLFQVQLLPNEPADRLEIFLHTSGGLAQLCLQSGWTGAAQLKWEPDKDGTETWPSWHPWSELVTVLEAELAGQNQVTRADSRAISWQSAIRGLELDDAARRSVQHRRASLLEYPEATEEVGFKGAMTLAGCALLWGVIMLVVLSMWVPWLGWMILPVLLLFLGLQLLRWLIPRKP